MFKSFRLKLASFVMWQWKRMSVLSAKVYSVLWKRGNGL